MIWALHGALGAPSDWDALGFPVRAVDLYAAAPMELGTWQEEFVKEVEETDANPSIIGYSMGGRLALHALLEKPEIWRAAVIVSAHPGLEDGTSRAERLEHDREWGARARSLPWNDFLDRWNSQVVLEGSAPTGGAIANAGRREQIGAAFDAWSTGRQMNLLGELKRVSCPVLWVVGERDGKFRDLGEKAVSELPDGRIWMAKGSGHRVPWETPDDFRAKLLAFFRECGIE